MRLAYNLSIELYGLALRLASFFHSKAKKWRLGRKGWKPQLRNAVQGTEKPTCWIHCASLGEFEQARPLIEKIKMQGNYFVLLSFFSPSGFEIQKNYDQADYVCYLPLDRPSNAKIFLEITKPKLVLFVKYEFWFNYLNEIKSLGIPCYLVSGIFRPSQHFFKSYGGWFRKQLEAFEHFFVQNEASAELLKGIGLNNYTVASDTRFDRVAQLPKINYSNELVETFKKGQPLLILGSSWEAEHEFAHKLSLDFPNLKILIAPHEIEEQKILAIQNKFSPAALRISEQKKDLNISKQQVLILDEMGSLSLVYRYADLVIIGGGFGAGIHNTLEAATYGKPVLFGPKYEKFQEALDLIDRKAAFSFANYQALKMKITMWLEKPDEFNTLGENAAQYVQEKSGATALILKHIN